MPLTSATCIAALIRTPMNVGERGRYVVCLPSMSGETRSVGLGQVTSLPTVRAAPVPRAVGQLLTSAPTRGADYMARGGGLRMGDRGVTR
jgi:hypothetical protein